MSNTPSEGERADIKQFHDKLIHLVEQAVSDPRFEMYSAVCDTIMQDVRGLLASRRPATRCVIDEYGVERPSPFWRLNNRGGNGELPYVIERDGSDYCATRLDFINVQESPSGFGTTIGEAMCHLKHNEAEAASGRGKA